MASQVKPQPRQKHGRVVKSKIRESDRLGFKFGSITEQLYVHDKLFTLLVEGCGQKVVLER